MAVADTSSGGRVRGRIVPEAVLFGKSITWRDNHSRLTGSGKASALKPGRPGEAMADIWAIDIKKGGRAIPYNEEDPYIRKEFVETLAAEGVPSRMEDKLYEKGD